MRALEKRREAEREGRRRSILRAAEKLYAKNGFDATTMEEIARSARLGTATTYYYFKNKEEVYVSLVLKALDTFIDTLEDIEAREIAPREKVRAIWDCYFEYYRKYPAQYRALLFLHRKELPHSLSAEIQEKIRAKSDLNFRIASRIIEGCIASGDFEGGNSHEMADVLWSSFMGIVHLTETRKNLGVEARSLEALHKQTYHWLESAWLAS